MVRTRVGYSGGEKPDPTYHDLGDHTETLQIDYDPGVVSYPELLEVFWESHSPEQDTRSRQYMAAVFYHDQAQKEAIDKSLDRLKSKINARIQTRVLPYTGFTRAEDYHQKYILRQSRALMREFQRMYPSPERLVDSTAAARVNGYLAGHGGCARLKAEVKHLGLSPEGTESLLQAVCGRR